MSIRNGATSKLQPGWVYRPGSAEMAAALEREQELGGLAKTESAEAFFPLKYVRRQRHWHAVFRLFNHEIEVPNVPAHEDVELHLIPDTAKQNLEVRVWFENKMVHSFSFPMVNPRVHF
jgi:hypothetical protein